LASPQHIRQRHRDGAGAEPPPPDHDGIEDTFIEKASVVWYWHAGRWSQLAGAD
jgi:hypothetical protein